MSSPHPIMSTRPPSASSINMRSQNHMPVCGSILKTSQNQTVVSGTSQTELLVLPLWKWSCYALHVLFREAGRPQSKSAVTSPCHPDFGNRTWQALEITWLLQRLHSTRSWAKEGFFFFFSGLQYECLLRESKRREGLIEWKRPLLGAREMGQRLKRECYFLQRICLLLSSHLRQLTITCNFSSMKSGILF